MPFVKIPPAFFKKAKLEYSDWRFAWFREVIQNSADAGSTSIRFELSKTDEGDLVIEARDNGCGMTQEVIEGALLALGGSVKPLQDNPVGGFGMAKNIILLAHKSWTVHSKNVRVHGAGGSYELDSGQVPYLEGTLLRVTFDPEDSSESLLKLALDRFMAAFSSRHLRVYFNGELRPVEPLRSTYEKDLALGHLVFDPVEGSNTHSLWVRVNGIPMFEYRIWSRSNRAFKAFLELKNGLEVLTVNRDGLRDEPRRELNELIHKLSEDLSSLKRGTLQFTVTLNPSDGIVQHVPSQVDEVFAEDRDVVLDKLRNLRHRLRNRLTDPAYPKDFEVRVHSIGLKRASSGEVISVRDVRKVLGKSINKKLATAWVVACKALLTLPRFAPHVSFDPQFGAAYSLGFDPEAPFVCMGKRVYFGFVFDNSTEACCVVDDSSITLSVNPFVFTEELPWKSRVSIANLMDLAYHEVAHIFESSHSSDFCAEEVGLRRQFRRKFEDRLIYMAVHQAFRALGAAKGSLLEEEIEDESLLPAKSSVSRLTSEEL